MDRETKPTPLDADGVPGIGTWEWHEAAGIMTWSAAMAGLWGLDATAVPPGFDAMWAPLHADDRALLLDALRATQHGGPATNLDCRIAAKGNAVRWLRIQAEMAQDTGRAAPTMRGMALDVTGYYAVRQALEEREAELKSILDTVPDAMIMVDDRGTVRSFSATAERMFGHAAADVIGRSVRMLMPEPDRDRHDSYMQRYMTTGERRIIGVGRVVTGQRADGSDFPLHLTIGEVGRRPGKRLFTGFVEDLSERHASEARMAELRAELLHVSRLGDMGQMASALAHELNQPLTAAAAAVRAAERILALPTAETVARDDLREAMSLAADQVLRAGQIVWRLRDFVDKGRADRHHEDLAKVVEDSRALALPGTLERGVAVRLELAPGVPPIMMDRVQIQQVLVNLMRNAVEAMCGEGATPSDRPRELLIATTAGDPVGVVVADTGPGLAPEVAARLFEPFVSTKRGGMGVGLSICQSIIESHGGRLWAEPRPGGGTVFRFVLPASASATAEAAG